MNESITAQELEDAVNALESWHDAFQDEEPEQAKGVLKIIERFNMILDQMRGPEKPQLKLVPHVD